MWRYATAVHILSEQQLQQKKSDRTIEKPNVYSKKRKQTCMGIV